MTDAEHLGGDVAHNVDAFVARMRGWHLQAEDWEAILSRAATVLTPSEFACTLEARTELRPNDFPVLTDIEAERAAITRTLLTAWVRNGGAASAASGV